MQNILYIGPYKENNGLGKSSKRFVDALITNNNLNLSIRPVFYHQPSDMIFFNNDLYNEFENNSFKYYDAIIQHGCPSMFEYHGSFGKNIGICQIETKNIGHSGWIEKINLLDEIITHSIYSVDSLIDSGTKTSVRILPEPYDLKLYESNDYPNFFTSNDKKPFIFYTIGSYIPKNNIKGIILAYLLEFNKEDNTQLFIKTHSLTHNSEDLKKIIEYDIENTKNIIRKNNIPDIDILCGYLDDSDIIRLHKDADCYVNCARGDSFGSCSIEAMLCDKSVINTKNIGSSTYLNSQYAFMVESSLVNVYSDSYFDKNTFTIYEEWYEPNIASIRQNMRLAFENKNRDNSMFDKNIFDKYIVGKSII